MPTPANVLDLRRMLAERFPEAHASRVEGASRVLSTGVTALDHVLGGGLPQGEITELVGEGDGSGSGQVIHAVLAQAARDGRFLALVDAADSFDVDAPTAEALRRLLWVRCRSTEEALKATDVLLRDRNVPCVILDLKPVAVSALRKISASVWHRFGRIAEHQGTTLFVVTPQPIVGGVSVRVASRAQLRLEALRSAPSETLVRLRFELLRSVEVARRAGGVA